MFKPIKPDLNFFLRKHLVEEEEGRWRIVEKDSHLLNPFDEAHISKNLNFTFFNKLNKQ